MGGTTPQRGLPFALQMAQELGISEKSPDYHNPFKTDQSEVRWHCCQLASCASPSLLQLQTAGWGMEWVACGEWLKAPSLNKHG